MKHRRAFKKYLRGGAILIENDASEARQIQAVGVQLQSLNNQISGISTKFANQTAQFSDYEQLAGLTKKFNNLFQELVMGQLKYSMYLRESFLHKASEIKDIDVARGKLQKVVDIAKERVLPAVGAAATYYVAGTSAPVAAAVGVGLYVAPKLMTSIYYSLKTLSTKLTYYVQSYKRYFQSLKNSLYYLAMFMPETRADMNKLYYAVEGSYSCFMKHTIALDSLQRCLRRMELRTEAEANAPQLLANFQAAVNNCQSASAKLTETIGQVASHYGYGWNYVLEELKNAQLLQGVLDNMMLESASYMQHFEAYHKELILRQEGQTPTPPPPPPAASGAMQYGKDLPPIRRGSPPPPQVLRSP